MCFKFFKDDFSKVTSQFLGPIEQEDNLKELLTQIDSQALKILINEFNLYVPEDLLSSHDPDLVMIEILVEELSRH